MATLANGEPAQAPEPPRRANHIADPMSDRPPVHAGSPHFGERSLAGGPGAGFGRMQARGGVALIVAALAALLWSAVAGQATPAHHPQLFGGSIVLDDYRPPVVLDLATGQVTVRLRDVFAQVGATSYAEVQAVPVEGGTVLVDRTTGAFNFLGRDNYVVKAQGGGVGLGPLAGLTGAAGIAVGDSAFILRYAPRPTVSLVGLDTVQAAVAAEKPGATGRVTPRGFATLQGPVADRPGAAVTTGGDLWLLVGRPAHLVRLHTQVGGGLAVTDRGAIATATSAAALEAGAAGVAGDSRGATTPLLGLATPGNVRLVPRGAAPQRDLAVPATKGASEILPVTGAGSTLWYLARGPDGWSAFGVDSAGRVVGPHHLGGVAPRAQLAGPVLSHGAIYTMDKAAVGQPALWQIDPATGAVATVAGAARYPAASSSERANFNGAEVVVSGPRVIFDNPDSLLGVVVFTDGSRPATVIDKSAAVDINAVGPAAVQAANQPTAQAPSGQPAPTVAPAPPPPAAPQVSQQVTCADTTQTPRAPQITQTTPSAHSVLVAWSYPLLDNHDCEPDTWIISMRAVGAPQPGQPVQAENGQLQYQFSGLRSSTSYQVTVTAQINKRSTPSAPAGFTTAPTGPDAATSVRTSSDGQGHWTVSWTLCTAATCYVPAQTWTVTGSACGPAFVGQPPSQQVDGSATSATFDASALGLLGKSLSFQVQGRASTGLTGDPTSDHSCTQAWRPPDPSHITLQAAAVPAGLSVTAKLVVSATEAPVDAFGSTSTLFTYQVGSTRVGPTAAPTVTVAGLTPGTQYQASVTVAPAGHPQAAVSVNAPPFSQTLSWPGMTLLAAGSVNPVNPNQGTLTASFVNLPPVPLAGDGRIVCGSFAQNVGGNLSSGRLVLNLDLTEIGGGCTLSLILHETSTSDFGIPSPALTASFAVGTQPSASSFSAIYGTVWPPAVTVSGDSGNKGVTWSVAVTSPQDCKGKPGTFVNTPGAPSFPVTLSLSACDIFGFGRNVEITVSWTYLGTRITLGPFAPNGTPPTTTTTSTSTTTTTKPVRRTTTTSTTAPSSTTSTSHLAGGPAHPPATGSALSPPTMLASRNAPVAAGNRDFGLVLGAPWAMAALWALGHRRRRKGTSG